MKAHKTKEVAERCLTRHTLYRHTDRELWDAGTRGKQWK